MTGLRVLQVLPGLVPGGGAEQSLVMIAPHLLATGIELHLAYLERTSGIEAELVAHGVTVHDLRSGGGLAAKARGVRRLLRNLRPTIVHSSLYDADIPVRLGVLGTGTTVLTTWANTTYDPSRLRLEPGAPRWKREAVRMVDGFTGLLARSHFQAVTEGVAESNARALLVPRRRVTVVERGRDLGRFAAADPATRAAARATLGVGDGETALVCVARQFHQKGHVHLLAAVDTVMSRHHEVRLVLIGPEGPATPEVRAALAEMRHADRVVELGERTDVDRLLAGADAFVLASIVEGAAGAVLEALASGVPVVATDVAGFRGWFEDGRHGLLARPGDPEDLERRIEDLLADPDSAAARAAAGRRLVEERFSVEASAAAMERLYRNLAARG